jgi:N-acetylglucosaminyldiphosphoundecaprenol N-acetyl-beta-D-mannosaminyltransferase
MGISHEQALGPLPAASKPATELIVVARGDAIVRVLQVRIDDLRLHAVTQDECVQLVMQQLHAGKGGWIATANIDHLWHLRRHPEFRAAYAATTLRVADGMPLIWISRIQGTKLPERVAGSDLIHSLSHAAAVRGRRVFLLGGNAGIAERAAACLCATNPGLQVAGTACPPHGFEKNPEQLAAVRAQLAASGADLVFVALGAPKQELFIAGMRDALPNAWWMGVGISFSFVAGEIRRAPRWMQRTGCEWLHRLAQEPRRLCRRYLWNGPPFAARLLGQALWRRFRGTN